MRSNAPELLLGLAPPATDAEIEDTERFLAVTFPDEVRWLYRQHNGSIDYTGPPLDGGIWLSLEGMRRTWTMWKDTYEAYSRAGVWNDIPGVYAHETWIPRWVPLTDSMGAGWTHWVDLDPGPKGTLGQILLVYSDSTAVVAPSICQWLWNYLGELEAGKWVRSKNGGLRRHDHPDQ